MTLSTSKKLAANATLHVFVYTAPTKSRSNPHCRRRTFPASALVASQDGFLSGNHVTVACHIGTGRGKFVICCCVQAEDQGSTGGDQDYEYDTPLRCGDFQVHVTSEEEDGIELSQLLPPIDIRGFDDNKEDTMHCESILNKMRDSRLPGATQGTGPINKLDWDFLTLSKDPVPLIVKQCNQSKFVDSDFLPTDTSVNKDPHDTQCHYERWVRNVGFYISTLNTLDHTVICADSIGTY